MAPTPGPWTFDPSEAGEGAITIRAEHGQTVAEVFGGMTRASEMAKLPSIRRANARLIAAAPDLLAALKAVVRGYDGPTVDAANAVSSHIAAARAAIAKAEGAK